MSSSRPRNGLTKYAPALATINACGEEKTRVMLTRIPSLASTLSARTPSGIMGILTTMFGCHVAISRPSRRIPAVSVDTTSAFTTPSFTILQISKMCSRKGRFSLAIRVGLVVTPSITPSATPCRISSKFAVSRKNFMFVASLSWSATRLVGVAPRRSGRAFDDRVAQRPNACDGYFDGIARVHRSDACRCTSCDHIARHERHHTGNPRNYNINREHHRGEGGILLPGAIQQGFHGAGGKVEFGFEDRPKWAKRVEAFGAGPLLIQGLVFARAHVVQARVPGNVGPDIVAVSQLGAFFGNDDSKLAFKIHAPNSRRQDHGIIRREK